MTTDVHSLSAPQREHGPLEGNGIVVTRPLRQAAVLATRIATLGGVPIIWPAIVILPPPDRGPLERAHATLADYDIAIFVSANASRVRRAASGLAPARGVTYAPGREHRGAGGGRRRPDHDGCRRRRSTASLLRAAVTRRRHQRKCAFIFRGEAVDFSAARSARAAPPSITCRAIGASHRKRAPKASSRRCAKGVRTR
jgi:hypothetical protein